MRFLLAAVAFFVVSCASGCTSAPSHGLEGVRWVDLTHAFSAETVYWPTASGFEYVVDAKGRTPGGWWYESNTFRTSEHGGTHLDAPCHFAEGAFTSDQIPIEQLVGPACVVDVRDACAADRDYQVTVEDLLAFEARYGRIPPGAIVLLRTGFEDRYPDRARYMGTAERGLEATFKLHFPGLSPRGAKWLAERGIGAVGIDTPSIDHGPSRMFFAHRELYARNIPGLENVANLGALPPTGATVVALPMKIQGGSGGPLRIVAALPRR